MSNKAGGGKGQGGEQWWTMNVHHSAFLMQVKHMESEVKYMENLEPEQPNWKAFGQ